MKYIIIIGLLFVINFVWFAAYLWKKKGDAAQLRILAANNEPYTEEELKDEIEPKQSYIWICAVVVCLDIWMIGALLTHWWAGKYFTEVAETDNNKALFGDSFGAVNALISAFAFAGMIAAFFLQRYELRLQRKELKAQRDEFSQQNTTLRLQRFENTFFNMMELQQQIVSDLSTKDAGRDDITGRELFRYTFEKGGHPDEVEGKELKGLREVVNVRGFSFYDQYYPTTYFDHYFRFFYRILKFVDQNSWLGFEEQYKYTSMLRGTLSRYELVWLFYNGLSDNGRDKLKPLMERYSMLKNLRPDLLTLSKDNRDKGIAAGVNSDTIKENKFSCSDYEFSLSDQESPEKYHLSAFYSEEEMQEGTDEYNRWKSFCEEKGIRQ